MVLLRDRRTFELTTSLLSDPSANRAVQLCRDVLAAEGADGAASGEMVFALCGLIAGAQTGRLGWSGWLQAGFLSVVVDYFSRVSYPRPVRALLALSAAAALAETEGPRRRSSIRSGRRSCWRRRCRRYRSSPCRSPCTRR